MEALHLAFPAVASDGDPILCSYCVILLEETFRNQVHLGFTMPSSQLASVYEVHCIIHIIIITIMMVKYLFFYDKLNVLLYVPVTFLNTNYTIIIFIATIQPKVSFK